MIIAVPFLAFCILFNGLIIQKASAPPYLQWVFEVSPMRYALQAIMLRLADGATEMEAQMVLGPVGFAKGEDTKGILVIIAMLILFRVLQIVCTKYMHNVQK